MTLTCTARAKLAAVVVVLDEGNHPGEQMPFRAHIEMSRFHAGRAQQHIHPLVFTEILTCLQQRLHVHVGHLNWLEVMHREGRTFRALFEEVVHRHDAPDTSRQELLELLDKATGDLGVFDPKIHKQSLIDIAALVQAD